MSSLTILFLLILLLMSFGNLFGVYSIFGYDADYWEVGIDILAVIDDNEDIDIQDIFYIIFLNLILWIGVAALCSLFEYDFIIHPCVSSKSHFCITFDFEDESYICYAFWVPYEVYINNFSKFHHFTLVLSS